MSVTLDGSTQLINCSGNLTALNNLTTFTWSAWINPSGFGQGGFGVICSKGTGTGQKRWLLNGTNGGVECAIDRTAGASFFTSNGTITLNTWQFVVLTYSSAAGPRMYKNGVEVSYSSGPTIGSGGETSDSGGNFFIGDWSQAGSTGSFAGSFRQVTVHAAILTPAEQRLLMLGDLLTNQSTLRGGWNLETAVSPAQDISGNNNNGTLTGTTGTDPSGVKWVFPRVESVNASHLSTNTATFNVDFPTGILPGHLVLAAVTCDGVTAMTWPTVGTPAQAWLTIANADGNDNANTSRVEVRYLIAQSALAGQFQMSGGSENWAARTWRISGMDIALAPQAAAAVGLSATPDPQAVTPTWGLKETLWISLFGQDGAGTVSAFPAQYSGNTHGDNSGGAAAQGVVHGAAERSLLATTDNPGTFTASVSEDWRAVTVAIAPGTPELHAALNVSRVMSG